MSRNAPTTAPTSGMNMVTGWQSHWLKDYHEPRLVSYRGKIAIAVTKPKDLRKPKDKDKKLSANTNDPFVAQERKWEVAAKIYRGFDEARTKIDPQVTKNKEFLSKVMEILASHGHTDPRLDSLNNPFLEQDEVVRLLHALGIKIPDEIIPMLNDEAKYWLKALPFIGEKTEADIEREKLFGKEDPDVLSTMKQMQHGIEYIFKNPDTPNRELIESGLVDHSKKLALNTEGFWHNEADKGLAIKLQQTTSSISVVGELYIKERKWARERTKAGAKLAIERFCNVVGGETDINDINAKDAYEFAQWMDDELGSANKSIKAAVSYVKGMFTWAITKKDYTITKEPWGTLNRISDYGKPEQSYIPLKKQQLVQLFDLIDRTGTGKMNRREHFILSILITTGCRLDEAALLCWENIIQHEDGWHYIDLRRALVKNHGSKRKLPIPDCLWPLFPKRGHRVTVDGISYSPNDRLFDYSLDKDGKAARASSQACGRQLEKIDDLEPQQVTHSLRGNLKDLLRDVGISKELNNYITGHGQGDVGGDRYGEGHSIETRYEALNKVKHPYIKKYPA